MKYALMMGWMAAGFVLNACAGQEAGGLKMNYSRIVVDNLPIGQPVSMQRLASLPLKLGNGFGFPIEVRVSIAPPAKPRPGYECIPDPLWIRPEVSVVEVPAHGERELDMVISVPDDPALFGRRFHADVVVATKGNPSIRGGVRTGYEITGNLLFSVAPQRNEQALQAALDQPASAAFRLDPPRVDVFDVRAGQALCILGPDQTPVRLINESGAPQTYELEAVASKQSAYKPDDGCQAETDPGDVRMGWPECRLAPGASTNLQVSIQIPSGADLNKGPLLYQVAVRNGASRKVEQYLKIYVWPGPKPLPERPPNNGAR